MTRYPIYVDDIHSVPTDWAEVSDDQFDWAGDRIAVRKQRQIFYVSRELLEDVGDPSVVFGMLRPQSWESRLRQKVYESRPDRRLRRWWWRKRTDLARAVAARIDPMGY